MTVSADPLAPTVRLAPAKINLTLAILGRRPDGFHSLHSVMAPLALADRLSLTAVPPPAAARAAAVYDSLHVSGFDAGPPADNLVLRAIAVARDAARPTWPGAPAVPPPLAARLDKRIPVSAGLAGGSSDGAAALDGALEAWSVTLGDDERRRLAARLGSDVPFFLAGGIALVEGRGERVTRLNGLRSGSAPGVLLVTPALAISTADAFAAYAEGARPTDGGATHRTSEHLADELASGSLLPEQLVARAGVLATANDLVPATALLAPALPRLRRALGRVLGRPVGQTGSGPTLWALFASVREAAAAVDVVDAAIDDGRLEPPGSGRPLVVATTLAPRPEAPPPRGAEAAATRAAV
jgi:4-diphosphocytidyl-2-C-methyl-D-erythritol kinase